MLTPSVRRAVVVDDDDDIRDLVVLKLRMMGLEVHAAADGEAGLELCKAVSPDVVVLDINMPVMSGLEVVAALRSSARHQHLPVVLLSALAQESDIATGLRLGADDYVTKPFSPADLAARITTLLDRASRSGCIEAG